MSAAQPSASAMRHASVPRRMRHAMHTRQGHRIQGFDPACIHAPKNEPCASICVKAVASKPCLQALPSRLCL
eukprot:351621-Chlamydomonas_euryale.AAC.2